MPFWNRKKDNKPAASSPASSSSSSSPEDSPLVQLARDLLGSWRSIVASNHTNTAVAEREYRSMIAKHPEVLSAYNNLAVLCLREQKIAEARQHLDHILSTTKGSVVYLAYDDPLINRSVLHILEGEVEAAKQMLLEAKKHKAAYANLCAIEIMGGNFTQAIQYGRDAVENFPDEPVAHVNLVSAYVNGGRKSEGEAALMRAIQRFGQQTIQETATRPFSIQTMFSNDMILYDAKSGAFVMASSTTGDMMVMRPK